MTQITTPLPLPRTSNTSPRPQNAGSLDPAKVREASSVEFDSLYAPHQVRRQRADRMPQVVVQCRTGNVVPLRDGFPEQAPVPDPSLGTRNRDAPSS